MEQVAGAPEALAGWRHHPAPRLSYLIAGMVIGPYMPGFVGDVQRASQLAEVGVILPMFGVGLHFDIGDLWAVKWKFINRPLCTLLRFSAISAGELTSEAPPNRVRSGIPRVLTSRQAGSPRHRRSTPFSRKLVKNRHGRGRLAAAHQ
jgi:hypothetical protein